MLNVLLVLLTPVAILGYLQRLIQRRAPTIKLTTTTVATTTSLTENDDYYSDDDKEEYDGDHLLLDLEEELPPPPQQTSSRIQLERNGLINPNDRTCLKKAFRRNNEGSSLSASLWIATGKARSSTNEDDGLGLGMEEPAIKAWHQKISDYMVESQLAWSEQHGYVLSSRRQDDDDDHLQGILCLIPPIYYDTTQNPNWQYQLQYATALRMAGLGSSPISTTNRDDGSKERWEAFRSVTNAKHRTIMKDTPHWYIPLLVEVAEDEDDDQGMARQLLFQQSLQDIIGRDDSNLPIYLECPTEKVSFFERMGFQCVETYDILPQPTSNLNVGSSSPPYQYNAMVRPGRFHIV